MKKIVLTGGPCGGKTTAKNYLQEKLSDYGWTVIFVPEQATRFIDSGLKPWLLPQEKMIDFQELIVKAQMLDEDENFSKAMVLKGGENQVMICDRGCAEGKAFIGAKNFNLMLRRNNFSIVKLRDERYDAVFHLVTAAEGKEEFYNLDNPARTETPDQARALDARIREAWLGHPHLRIIDNSTLFDKKLERLLNEVRKVLGIPVAIETERKFLVKDFHDIDKIPVAHQIIEVEQVYLKKRDGVEARIRKRGQANEGEIYYETKKFPTGSPISRIEIEKRIDTQEYWEKLKDANLELDPIKKLRVCFLWKNQYFELDFFQEPERIRGLTLLEIELTEENDEVSIPDWLGEVIEVSEDPKYKNKNLARRPT